MSLKAKLEAVIYAAEEPVTLSQLALLFADEALEWRAEQEKAAAEAAASTPSSDQQSLLTDAIDYFALEQQAEEAAPVEEGGEQSDVTAPEAPTETPDDISTGAPAIENSATENSAEESLPSESLVTGSDAAPEANPDPSPELTPEEAARQAARQRDREVRNIIRELLDELVADYATDRSGVEIREIAGGYRMGTKPEYHDAVRAFVKSLKPAMKLSLPALETLAVIAYKQPVTAPEVNEIRGVDSSGVFGSLLARKLIATAGRKQVVGRPILYKTTKEFLLRFGLKDVGELPSMEEFEKMAASEFEESELAGAEPGQQDAEEAELEKQLENADEPGASQSSEEMTGATEPAAEAAPASEEAPQKAPETTLE